MMKVEEDLLTRAALADDAMGELADQEEARLNRRKAYDALEHAFDMAASDGELDAKELQSLMRDFRAQGLDTSTLEQLAKDLPKGDKAARVHVGAELRDKIGEQFREAKYLDTDKDFNFKVQMMMDVYRDASTAAASASKAENEIYMVAVRHLIA